MAARNKIPADKFYDAGTGVDAAKLGQKADAAPARPTTTAKKPAPKTKAAAHQSNSPRHTRAPVKSSEPAHSGLEAMRVDGDRSDLTADGSLAADIERIRKIRKPFGAMTQKLALPPIPGYRIHWFSDDPGRVEDAINNGWAHIKGKDDGPMRRVVGRARDGSALYGYAMKLPSVFWEEDMAVRHARATAQVQEIKKAPFRAKPGQLTGQDEGKFYSAKEQEGAVQINEGRASGKPYTGSSGQVI